MAARHHLSSSHDRWQRSIWVRRVLTLLLLKNTGERLAHSWAGSREGALRVVAMLRIIDAAELAYALQYIQERETANAGRVIDAETLREVRK